MRYFQHADKVQIERCEAIEQDTGYFRAEATTAKGEKWVMQFMLGKTIATQFAAAVQRRGWVARDAWRLER